MNCVIEVRDLVNRFAAQHVHDRLDLRVMRREVLAIVGGSGSGKSVLLRSILGLHRPTSGSIRVLGRSVNQDAQGMARCWGVLFQDGALLSELTVLQNVELPIKVHSQMHRRTRTEIAELKIRMSGLGPSAYHKYPAELSGGMRKRASLARALALDPKILFLDEPTAGLDPIGATDFDKLIAYLRESLDLTIVLITHDLDTLFTICDRVAVIVDGKAIVGPVPQILQNPHPWIQQYFAGPRAHHPSQRETLHA